MTEREEALEILQKRMQLLWDKIEWREALDLPTHILQCEFWLLEAEEAKLLHTGALRISK